MRHHDKRPPLRRTVHAESQRQTHIQERVRQDTRGMRGKARRVDRGNEGRDQSGEGEKETDGKRIKKEGDHGGRPQKSACNKQRKNYLLSVFIFDSIS